MVRVGKDDVGASNPDGGGLLAAGRYLFVVNDITTSEDSIQAELAVLAGKVNNPQDGGQVGKTHKEFFNLFGKAASRLLQFFCAVELLTKDQWRACKENQADVECDETLAVGRMFCGEIKMEPYQGSKEENKGKEFPRLGFNIWSVTDPKSADIVDLPEAQKHVRGLLNGKRAANPQPPATGGGEVDPFAKF